VRPFFMSGNTLVFFLGALLLSAQEVRAEQVTETQKILVLISTVEALGDAVFLKEDARITCAQAADWMRQDPSLQDEYPAARAFLERVSMSAEGKAYWILLKDGRRIQVFAFLLQTLERLESMPPDAE
jgi:hypothetical protein